MKQIKTDVTIVGAGLAGLFTALNIDSDIRVDILIKESKSSENSNLAQGGIAGVLNKRKVNLDAHVEDTLVAGSFYNDQKMVDILVNEAKENIDKLIEYRVNFDYNHKGELHLTKEGGHSKKRIIHANGDTTGKGIMDALKEEVKSRDNIFIHIGYMAVDVIKNTDGFIKGLKAINEEEEVVFFHTSQVVLATGGIGNIYGATTNYTAATGDGIAMTDRLGLECLNMEFVQFHPTAFYNLNNSYRQKFLITEALRGEGAYLRNIEGERFMYKYDERGELAPRDIVSQSMYREMYDTWSDYVYLDTLHLEQDYLKNRFPMIYNHLEEHDFILGKDLIPVAPVQHFMVGGIKVNEYGETDLKGLFAVGECASNNVHGANRLASNSLLECIVFGNRVARKIVRSTNYNTNEYTEEIVEHNTNYNYRPMKRKLGQVMDEYVGIVRTKDGLENAKKHIDKMFKNLTKYPSNNKYYYEALNMVTTAKLIVYAAIKREESLGCHYRIN